MDALAAAAAHWVRLVKGEESGFNPDLLPRIEVFQVLGITKMEDEHEGVFYYGENRRIALYFDGDMQTQGDWTDEELAKFMGLFMKNTIRQIVPEVA
jgi:hypothetical protein